MGIQDVLGVRPVINAAGTLTRLGGMPLHPDVADAMADAARECARVEDVQAAAGEFLAHTGGAEAAYVTSGAAAGLTMSAAACMAGLDPAAMDRLPDTSGIRNEIIVQRAHMTAYTHSLRVAGAKLIDVGYVGHPGQGITWPWQIEAAINDRTAALFYSVGSATGIVELEELAAIGRGYELPVIVDAAAALPPKENLWHFIERGADLVSFSGGKAIGGPQASGILLGRKHLIESVALQHQDMDVYPETWTLRGKYLDSKRLPGPPHHGLGRPMKVGKEEIVGLVVALKRFLSLDVDAERARQRDLLCAVAETVKSKSHARTELLDWETPALLVYRGTSADARKDALELVNRLIEGNPPVAVSQNFTDQGAIGVIASTLQPEQVEVLSGRLVDALNS